MFRLQTVVIAAALAPLAVADDGPRPTPERPYVRIDHEDVTEFIWTDRLLVTPVAVGDEPLRYRLKPSISELTPGNAATHYARAMLESTRWELDAFWERDLGRPEGSDWTDFLHASREVLRSPDVDRFLGAFGNAIEYTVRGSRCERIDWDMRVRDEPSAVATVNTLLEDTQQTRTLARLLVLAQRRALLDGDRDRFAELASAQLRLADHTTREFLIEALVAAAIRAMQRDVLFEAIATTDDFNWAAALAEIDTGAMSYADLVEVELAIFEKAAPWARDPESLTLDAAGWANAFAETQAVLTHIRELSEGESVASVAADFMVRVGLAGLLPAAGEEARRGLIAAGYDAADLEGREPGQLVAMHSGRTLRSIRQRLLFAASLPYREAAPIYDAVEAETEALAGDTAAALLPFNPGYLLKTLAPSVHQAHVAVTRHPIDFAALRVVEALRHHAAVTGRLPVFLAEIEDIPVPDNPLDGEPFLYRCDDGINASLEVVWPRQGYRVELTLTGPAAGPAQ